jgi:uridine phosphorylase
MKNSELIINPDGSVYHLSLSPGDVASTIITVGDQDRVDRISKHFDSIELKRQNREFVTHTGYLGKQRVSVISTGIGTDNIDIVINELHALFHVDFDNREVLPHQKLNFIRLGTSGTLRDDIPLGTILASAGALGMDGLLHFYEHQLDEEDVDILLRDNPALKSLPRPYLSFADAELLEIFKDVYSQTGITITAPGFYAPQGREVNSPVKIPNFLEIMAQNSVKGYPITNLEMETAGIYGLAEVLGHRAISISAILANRKTGKFAANPDQLVEQMIHSAMDMISALH